MNKIIILLAFLVTSFVFAQDGKLRWNPDVSGKIIFLDKTEKTGIIKMNHSVFDVKYKKEENDKYSKIDYKMIERIIINIGTENERVFQYLKSHHDKFYHFVELLVDDDVCIYKTKEDRLSLFYSDYNRTTGKEWMDEMRRESNLNGGFGVRHTVSNNFNQYYVDLHITKQFYHYFLLKNGDTKLIKVEKYKKFIKRGLQHFNDCPEFYQSFINKEISTKDLGIFVSYYKEVCTE